MALWRSHDTNENTNITETTLEIKTSKLANKYDHYSLTYTRLTIVRRPPERTVLLCLTGDGGNGRVHCRWWGGATPPTARRPENISSPLLYHTSSDCHSLTLPAHIYSRLVSCTRDAMIRPAQRKLIVIIALRKNDNTNNGKHEHERRF